MPLNSNGFVWLTALCWAASLLAGWSTPLPPLWGLEGVWGLCVSMGCTVLTGVALRGVCSRFLLPLGRGGAGLWFALNAALPCPTLTAGALTGLGVVVLTGVLFGLYEGRRRSAGGMFAVCSTLSWLGMVCPPALWLVPVFMAGGALVKALDGRSFTASVVGVLTPWWLVWAWQGFSAHAFDFGAFGGALAAPLLWGLPDFPWLLALLAGGIALAMCALQGMAVNSGGSLKNRAFLGFLNLLSVAWVCLCVLWAGAPGVWMPLLLLLTAIQLARILK